jgi:hypothetical protein
VSARPLNLFTTFASIGIVGAALAYSPVGHAFNFGDMMSPGKWMGGGNRDRYDDEYGPPYGGGPWGGGYGPYGGGPWGGGYGPYGGGPWGGGYGPYGGLPQYAAPPAPPAAAAPKAPAKSAATPSSSNVRDAQIDALKRRLDQLEAKQQAAPTAPPPSDWGSSQPSGNWNTGSTTRDWRSSSATPPAQGAGSTSTSRGSGSQSKDWNSAPVFRPLGKY